MVEENEEAGDGLMRASGFPQRCPGIRRVGGLKEPLTKILQARRLFQDPALPGIPMLPEGTL